jgi:hypothetical protein
MIIFYNILHDIMLHDDGKNGHVKHQSFEYWPGFVQTAMARPDQGRRLEDHEIEGHVMHLYRKRKGHLYLEGKQVRRMHSCYSHSRTCSLQIVLHIVKAHIIVCTSSGL